MSIVSSNAPRVAAALPAHPGSRVIVPFVFAVAKYSGSLAQETHATVSVDSSQYRLPHERASVPQAGDGIYLGDDRIIESNVHSDVYISDTEECRAVVRAHGQLTCALR